MRWTGPRSGSDIRPGKRKQASLKKKKGHHGKRGKRSTTGNIGASSLPRARASSTASSIGGDEDDPEVVASTVMAVRMSWLDHLHKFRGHITKTSEEVMTHETALIDRCGQSSDPQYLDCWFENCPRAPNEEFYRQTEKKVQGEPPPTPTQPA